MFDSHANPSKATFARLVIERIRAAGGPAFHYDAAAFEIHHGANRAFLDNTYRAYCHARGEQHERILANFVAAFISSGSIADASFEEASANLVTVVREKALFSFSSLYWQISDVPTIPEQLTEPLTRWFAKAVVIDSPGFMSLVTEKMVADWRQSSDELFALGLEKLKASTLPKFREDRGVFCGTWNDDYDSSRILLPGLFDDLPIAGDPVVAIPNRLTLLVTGSENLDGIRRLLQRAEEIGRTEAKAHNPAPLRVRDGALEDFHVTPDSPIFHDVERAHHITALKYYEEQKEALGRLYKKIGKQLSIGVYKLVQLDGGAYRSFAVWGKGLPSLLPEVDEVLLMDVDSNGTAHCVARAPWSRLMNTVPDLLLDTKMFPPRHYVSRFPTAEELKRLEE